MRIYDESLGRDQDDRIPLMGYRHHYKVSEDKIPDIDKRDKEKSEKIKKIKSLLKYLKTYETKIEYKGKKKTY